MFCAWVEPTFRKRDWRYSRLDISLLFSLVYGDADTEEEHCFSDEGEVDVTDDGECVFSLRLLLKSIFVKSSRLLSLIIHVSRLNNNM